VRQLAVEFESFFEVNFETNSNFTFCFQDFGNPKAILEKLSVYFGMEIVPGKSLLFLDEIQAARNLSFFTFSRKPSKAKIASESQTKPYPINCSRAKASL